MISNRITITSTHAPARRPAHRARRRLAAVIGAGALALAACGSSDDDADSDTGAEEVDESAEASDTSDVETESGDENGEAGDDADDAGDAASSVDLAPVIECIEAADIVTAPTTFGDDFLAEQGIVAALGLGAMGNEFGGGSLYYFESAERAEEQAANFAAVAEDAVVQDGVVVVQYASAVQDEAAGIVLGCAT